MSDNAPRLAVLDELAWEPSVDAANIGVPARVGGVSNSITFKPHAAPTEVKVK